MKLRRSNLHALQPATQLAALADVFSVVLFFVVLTTTFVTLHKLPETIGRGENAAAHYLFVKDGAFVLRNVHGRDVSVMRNVPSDPQQHETPKELWDVLLRAKTEDPNIDRIIIVPAPNVPFDVALHVLKSVQQMPARFLGGEPISLFPKANFGKASIEKAAGPESGKNRPVQKMPGSEATQ